MRKGGEKRGNSTDRKRRKQWLLSHFGDGATCPCHHCGQPLTLETVEADRILPGGPYRRDNLVPACRRDNAARGTRPLGAWQPA